MAFSSLSRYISILEKNNELIRIDSFVDPVLEIAEITDRFSKQPDGGKALLFTNTGTEFPVLTNSMGSTNRISLALGVENLSHVTDRLEDLFEDLKEPKKGFMEKLSILPKLAALSGYFPSSYKGKVPVQEVVHKDPDLGILPVLKTWPYDGGRFFTLPMVITTDPDTGVRNVGMYRMQVFDRQTTGMHWHRHKTGANHYEKYKASGSIMPVAVALGGDPVLTYAATAPLPENIDEFLFAGFLRKKSVSLAPALTQDIMVPAEADIIIEGYVDPAGDKILEGPFGDHTGFYSLEDLYPVFHVTAITHRRKAVFPATLVGIPPQEDARIALATEKIFFMPIRQAIVPELTSMKIPDYGVAHNLTLVNIKKSYPGQARKVMNALWGAGQMMFNKVLIVADENVNLEDPEEILNLMSDFNPLQDLIFSSGPLDVLDHSADHIGFGGKLGIDFTTKFPEEKTRSSMISEFLPEKTSMQEVEIKSFKVIQNSRKDAVVCLVALRKGMGYNKNAIISSILQHDQLKNIPVFLITDELVNLEDFREFLWYVLNNLEANRDITIIKAMNQGIKIFLDGSSKISGQEAFPRDWPNIVTMDRETIAKVDDKWLEMRLGSFIISPSTYYQKLIVTQGARARKKE
jgi:4-hydroxy-3-polyprenylbenzoate decarboxylase